MSIFRKEIFQEKQRHVQGVILLARPVHFSLFVLLFGASAAVLLAFFIFASYTRKAQIQGLLLPDIGLVRVEAPQGGVVSQRLIREGDVVKAGAPLFILLNERGLGSQGNIEQRIETLLRNRADSLAADQTQLRRQLKIRADALEHKILSLQGENTRVAVQIELQRARVDLAEGLIERFMDLRAQGYISEIQLQDKQNEFLDQRQRLIELERAIEAHNRDIGIAKAERAELDVQSARDHESIARGIGSIQQDLTENLARRRVVVTAPHDGVVSGISADVGRNIAATNTLLTIAPPSLKLIAELYASSYAVAFVKPGSDVNIRFHSFPYQKFGQHHGRVIEVSRVAMRPTDIALGTQLATPLEINEPVYRIRVALDSQSISYLGQKEPLKVGMTLEASISLESRRIFEWIFEPAFAVTGTL